MHTRIHFFAQNQGRAGARPCPTGSSASGRVAAERREIGSRSMSPLRFLLGRIVSLFHQSSRQINLAHHVPRLPMGDKLHASVVAVGTLSAALAGGMLYFKEDPGEPAAACELSDDDEDAAMRRRFEEWMIKYGRKYKDKEEKALRYEAFKRNVNIPDRPANTRGVHGATFGETGLSDLTEEEWHRRSHGSKDLTEEDLLRACYHHR